MSGSWTTTSGWRRARSTGCSPSSGSSCIYIYIYICIYICVYICITRSLSIYIYICIHTCIWIFLRRGDDTVGNPHQAQIVSIQVFRFVNMIELRQSSLQRAIRANSISIDSILLPLLGAQGDQVRLPLLRR